VRFAIGTFLLLLGASALCSADPPASAAPPTLKVAPTLVVEVGRKCVITAETSAKKVTWQLPADVDALPLDGKRLAVWAPPGQYTLRAAVPSGDDVVMAEVLLTVTDGTAPIPPPKPKPKPDPDDGLGLKKASADGLAQVTDRDKRDELAKQQRAHASAVAAGAFASPAAILAGWRAANNRAEPDLTKPWAVAVSAKLAELHAAGKLRTNAEWAQAFNEIADGLGG
jgi:hypothetical protein